MMATTMTTTTGIGTAKGTGVEVVVAASSPLAQLEMQYFTAVSLYRRRSYAKCADVCNALLQAGHDANVQMFATAPRQDQQQENAGGGGGGVAMDADSVIGGSSHRYSSNLQRIGPRRQRKEETTTTTTTSSSSSSSSAATAAAMTGEGTGNEGMPTWLMEGVWQLKMRALTQRVFLDDLEVDDATNDATEQVELERIATAARPGSSIKTAFKPRPSSSRRAIHLISSSDGPQRPATARPGSSSRSRPGSALGTSSRVRATCAAAYTASDAMAKLYQASRLNPTIYAEREMLVKALFQFLYYHEADVQKAYALCEAVMDVQRQQATGDWWWQQQIGRCLLAMHYPRRAEPFLQQSLSAFPHPDTYLLLSRLHQRLEQPDKALALIQIAVDRHPFDIAYRTEQARIYDRMTKRDDALQIYRLISRLHPINVEALASIAVGYFYDNNPELALMYYRRILSLGVHSAELYANIALCCLYGGQIDLVLPCFQRALVIATRSDQKADVWYNLSFVAVTTGDFHLARRCLQLCLSADARHGAALNNLAVLTAHSGDILGAKSYLNAAKDVQPDGPEIIENQIFMDLNYKL